MKIKQNYSLFTIHYSLFVVSRNCIESPSSVRRWRRRETGAGAGTPETGVATKADVPCLKAPLRHRAMRPVCADATADAQHPKNGWQKYEKLHHSQAVTKALASCRRALRESGNDCLILK